MKNFKRTLLCGGLIPAAATFGWAQTQSRAFYVASGSIKPSFNIGQTLFYDANAYRNAAPRDGDVVLLRGASAELSSDELTLKRVVATPGQVVTIIKGRTFINGRAVAEPFAVWNPGTRYDLKIVGGKVWVRGGDPRLTLWMSHEVTAASQKAITDAKPEAIPAGKYLVLGDNRGNSLDSHVYGLIPQSRFVGRLAR